MTEQQVSFPSREDFREDIAVVLAEKWNNSTDPDHHVDSFDMEDQALAVYDEVVAPALDTLRWLHAEAAWHAKHHQAQAERLEKVAAEVERLKDVDAEAFAARFQVQSYDIELGRTGRTLARLLTEAGISPLPKRLWHLAHRVKEEFESVVRQRDDALAALEKQQALLSEAFPEDDDVPEHVRQGRAAAAALRAEYGFTPRLRSCVEAWSDCETGGYHPSCCRFPKSCSATIYDATTAKPEDLEAR